MVPLPEYAADSDDTNVVNGEDWGVRDSGAYLIGGATELAKQYGNNRGHDSRAETNQSIVDDLGRITARHPRLRQQVLNMGVPLADPFEQR